ncbi:hypothetical protein [Nostoc sp. MS1]|uniref:hypothetical protein n=1 Tax=Nostoc sp. MS1 TaxID=2764711 RepID=UPI001CC7EB19|nr:hypothetical protein [Nostoc sp. MS1]BCL40016.1 hypothetical protein NSMS1_64630 [Nostoc sp. MS1]
MTRWNITGTWTGEYSYDPNDLYPNHQLSVPFTLVVQQSWFGRFRGQVQDDPQRGIPEQGFVKGQITGYKISFFKRLPVFYVASSTGLKTLFDYWLEEYNISLDHEVEHPPIHYIGEFSDLHNQASGVWRLGGNTIRVLSQGKLIQTVLPVSTGIWRMERNIN